MAFCLPPHRLVEVAGLSIGTGKIMKAFGLQKLERFTALLGVDRRAFFPIPEFGVGTARKQMG